MNNKTGIPRPTETKQTTGPKCIRQAVIKQNTDIINNVFITTIPPSYIK